MSTLHLVTTVLSPGMGRRALIIHSGPAELLNSDVYTDGTFDADTLTPTDTLTGLLAITDIFTETPSFSESLSGDYLLQSTETLTPTATLGIPEQTASPFIETLTPTDTLSTPIFTASLIETPSLSDTLSGVLHVTSLFTDALTSTDTLSAGTVGSFSETLTFIDSLAAVQIPTAWNESLTVTDTLTGAMVISTRFTETLALTDILTATPLTTFIETLTVSDTLTGKAELESVFTESLTSTESLTGIVALYGTLTDSLTVSDSLSSRLTLLGVFTETVTAGDTLVQAQSQAVWAINAETGAVSEYVFTPTIRGLGAWRDQLYLATDTGLYALDATTDDGAAIEWGFRTGFSNLGTDRLKRILDVNVLARGAGDVLLVLVADRHGQKEERRYQLVKLTADALRDQVIKAGKGIASVYWQVGCQGIGPAEMDQLRLRIEPLSRRR